MLGTTCLLYGTTSRLFGRPAAALGTALFATLGVTQFLSAFATYDPMALFLLTLSAYLVIGHQRDDTLMSATLVTAVAPVVLGLADATKYATVLWNPVIIGLAACGPVLAGRTWRYGLRRAASFTAVLLALLGAGLMVGKAKYITGIKYTTLNRSQQLPGMGQPASLVFHDTWLWISVVLVLAAIGLFIASVGAPQRRRGATIAVGSLLLIGTFAAPVEQARLGTTVALQKHLVFGAWFGCILAATHSVQFCVCVCRRDRIYLRPCSRCIVLRGSSVTALPRMAADQYGLHTGAARYGTPRATAVLAR